MAVANLPEWNVYGPETPGCPRRASSSTSRPIPPGERRRVLRSAAGNQGVSVKFNKNQLPCFTLWKNRQAAADGYVTGLEPAINFPNRKSFEKEKGRVAILTPGESRRFEVSIEAHADAASVAAAEKAIAALQGDVSRSCGLSPTPTGRPRSRHTPCAVRPGSSRGLRPRAKPSNTAEERGSGPPPTLPGTTS